MKIVITGATGLIGRKLVHHLITNGNEVIALTRSPEKLPELPDENVIIWSDQSDKSAQQLPFTEAIKNAYAVVHLAGEGIADGLWTENRKKKLRDSRINSTKNIVDAISALPEKERPKTFICGSAIGIYTQSSEEQNEGSPLGNDFLAELCKDWESSASEANKLGVRTVILRTGLVLANEGGLLSKSGPVILGTGSQWMSWIHIQDVASFIYFALNNTSMTGAYNLTSPNPSTNSEFTYLIAKIYKVPFTVKIPEAILKIFLGELSQALLANQKVIPQKALNAGFKFKFENLSEAIYDLLGNRSLIENKFSTKQFVPMEKTKVFSFFSKAENLEILTPPWLNFHIIDKSTPQITKETLINYKLKLHGFPIRWKTLIKEWNPEKSFIDTQLSGPYRQWHHVHTFEDVPGGTLISDDVTFEVPGWWLGKLLSPIIKKDVKKIFNYRQKKIKEMIVKNSSHNL